MLPDRCSVTREGRQCVNPPEFIVSIVDGTGTGEYMVGVACASHKQVVSHKIGVLQAEGKIREGDIVFSPVKAVGTDCIRADADDMGCGGGGGADREGGAGKERLVQIGSKGRKF